MNPLNKTAVINPTLQQEVEKQTPIIPSPVTQTKLASQIPTHQGSINHRSLTSYSVRAAAVKRTETKASSSNRATGISSSSRPIRVVHSASSSPSPLVKTSQGAPIHPDELQKLVNRSRISQEESAKVYRELEGRMSEVVNAAITPNSEQTEVAELAMRLLNDLTANSDTRKASLWATLGASGRAGLVTAATHSTDPVVTELALGLLANLASSSDNISVELWATLRAAGLEAVISVATSSTQPVVAERALGLLAHLAESSDSIKAQLSAALGAAGHVAVLAAAANPIEPAVARQALYLLSNLTYDSVIRNAELRATLLAACRAVVVTAATLPAQAKLTETTLCLLITIARSVLSSSSEVWASLGVAGRAAVIAAATNLAEPAVAQEALYLLILACSSDVGVADLWTNLGAAGRTAVITAATTPTQPKVAENALCLLSNLVHSSDIRAFELSASLRSKGRAALVTAVKNTAQPAVATQAIALLCNLAANSDDRTAEVRSALGTTGRAAVITAATTPTQPPELTLYSLALLTTLTYNSGDRRSELWATLGAAGRAKLVTAATTPAQPAIADKALFLLAHLADDSTVRITELWAALGVAGREVLMIAATTASKPNVALKANQFLLRIEQIPLINAEVWLLLQPRLTQLWAATQQPMTKQQATKVLFQQIRENVHKTRLALNALNAAAPVIPMRHITDTLCEWGKALKYDEMELITLLRGIVQSNTSPQKMAVFIAAVMSGINLWERPLRERIDLRDQLMARPMAEGIDPAPYRQLIRLGFDAACGNTAAVIESQVLPASEKLQLLEILYASKGFQGSFLSAQATQENLSMVLLTPHLSRNFKLQAIGLILTHGQANSFQFKTILTWLKGEFKTDAQTVFTNPAALGEIGDAAIYALAEQRQQYLALYQNFRPHMTRDFIQEEIAHINLRVTAKEMPEDFGATLIFQLQQFLSNVRTISAFEDERKHDRKNRSEYYPNYMQPIDPGNH